MLFSAAYYFGRRSDASNAAVPTNSREDPDLLAGYITTPELAAIDSYIVPASCGGDQGILGSIELSAVPSRLNNNERLKDEQLMQEKYLNELLLREFPEITKEFEDYISQNE